MRQFIVRLDDSSKKPESINPSQCEPSLLPNSLHVFPRDIENQLQHAWPSHLKKRIHRNPRDLQAHVQSVLYHRLQHNSESAFSALCEVFVILGEGGKELRANLLGKCQKILTREQLDFLKYYLNKALDSESAILFQSHQAARENGVTMSIVSSQSSKAIPITSEALQLVETYKALGDTKSALLLLESALIRDPGDRTICNPLLDLYQKLHLKDAFYRTYRHLMSRSLACRERWETLDAMFSRGDALAIHKQQSTNQTKSGIVQAMTEYKLIDEVYLLPTAAGAFYVLTTPEADYTALHQLLKRLLVEKQCYKLSEETLLAVTGLADTDKALELLYQAQSLLLINGFDSAQTLSSDGAGTDFDELLPQLSSLQKTMLVDWNGLTLSSAGLDENAANMLSALSADLINVQQRHATRLQKNLQMGSQGWAAVDAYGSSRIGAWPLFVGEHRFMLVILGEPQLNKDVFVELAWLLFSRYGKESPTN